MVTKLSNKEKDLSLCTLYVDQNLGVIIMRECPKWPDGETTHSTAVG
jgi:hypothetical protein